MSSRMKSKSRMKKLNRIRKIWKAREKAKGKARRKVKGRRLLKLLQRMREISTPAQTKDPQSVDRQLLLKLLDLRLDPVHMSDSHLQPPPRLVECLPESLLSLVSQCSPMDLRHSEEVEEETLHLGLLSLPQLLELFELLDLFPLRQTLPTNLTSISLDLLPRVRKLLAAYLRPLSPQCQSQTSLEGNDRLYRKTSKRPRLTMLDSHRLPVSCRRLLLPPKILQFDMAFTV